MLYNSSHLISITTVTPAFYCQQNSAATFKYHSINVSLKVDRSAVCATYVLTSLMTKSVSVSTGLSMSLEAET